MKIRKSVTTHYQQISTNTNSTNVCYQGQLRKEKGNERHITTLTATNS